MEKRQTLIEIGLLLDKCDECPKKQYQHKPEITCAECKVYKMMRSLADSLEEGNKPQKYGRDSIITIETKNEIGHFSMSLEQYEHYKSLGYTDEKIIRMKGVSVATFYFWKRLATNGVKEVMTVGQYKQMKMKKMSDAEIVKKLGVSDYSFKLWKRSKNLSR